MQATLMLAVVFGLGQVIESFILTPRLIGERIGLHPLVVIFALLAFGQLFGFVGVLVALPASAVLLVAIRRAIRRDQYHDSSAADAPAQRMRALALTYVTGMTPRSPHSAVEFNLIPGVGEYFVFPALTTTGPCEIMVFEGIPGGPMDCWADVKTPAQHLETSLNILKTFLPWEYERAKDCKLTDDNGILAGRFAPTIRHPVATLPSGRKVLGLGDAVCLNDPITGQGSNNAAKAAAIYLQRILDHGAAPFDEAWMQGTFDRFWDYAQWVVGWTNMLLLPPPPFILEIMGTACADPRLAHRMANGFDDPRDFFPWFADPGAAATYLAELKAA